jgi:tRNA threonylcarbamoyladenosine biosynthesis protein TsaE
VDGALSLTIDLPDEAATGRLAASLAARAKKGDVIALSGPLGSGKTSFARAFIRARGLDAPEVPSPSFMLVEVYDGDSAIPVWHFDLYRIEKPTELRELGLEEALAEGICLIEWPERLGEFMPAERLDLALAMGKSECARVAYLSGPGSWQSRIGELGRD